MRRLPENGELMARTKTRTRTRPRSRSASSEKTIGRLLLAALLSWIAYVLLDHFTIAPDSFAMWASGAVAALTLTVRAGKGR